MGPILGVRVVQTIGFLVCDNRLNLVHFGISRQVYREHGPCTKYPFELWVQYLVYE